VPVKATDPLYILYTSAPPACPRGHARQRRPCGSPQVVHAAYLQCPARRRLLGRSEWAGCRPLLYCLRSLLHGCTTIIYEGKPIAPRCRAFWRVINQHKVKSCSPRHRVPAIKKEDPNGELLKNMISRVPDLFLAGERLDPTPTTGRPPAEHPVIDHWWQTETGWAIVANPMGIEQFPSRPARHHAGARLRRAGGGSRGHELGRTRKATS